MFYFFLAGVCFMDIFEVPKISFAMIIFHTATKKTKSFKVRVAVTPRRSSLRM